MKKYESATDWSSFPYLRFADEVEQYLFARPKGHANYYHYTSLGAIDSILDNGFCLSSVDRFNDNAEKAVFAGREKKYYSLCFSTGEQENLALWYLYSGVGGKGGRMQFSYNSVCKLMSSEFRLVEYDYDNHNEIHEIAILTKDNATFRLEEILYADKSKRNRGVDIKYNTMTNRGNISEEEWKKFVSRHPGFQKRQIWYFEKETRLLIELSDSLYQLLDLNKSYAVILEIPEDVLRYIKIRFAPKIESLNDSEILKYKNIMQIKARLQLSDHSGQVNINACKYCKRNATQIRTARMVIHSQFKIKDGLPQVNTSTQSVVDILNPQRLERRGFVCFAPNSDVEICHIALENINGRFEIHYGTEKAYQKKGYMDEALPVVISWLFSNTKIDKLYARIDNNPPSEHLLVKLGFQKTSEAYPKPGILYKLEKY